MSTSRLWRAALVLTVSLGYLGHVFHVVSGALWTRGIGDWMDPHFINVLLEHWYRCVTQLRDPSSPPIYFPVRHALGYSHGLILSAPFYIAVRPFLHPLIADNISLLLTMECGIVCLYILFRKLELSTLESLVLTAFFFTSQNVTNDATGIWSQRASVFFIPPIALLTLVSWRRSSQPLALTSGLLTALLLTQDFPTAVFAGLLFALTCAPFIRRMTNRPWLVAFGIGAAIGIALFFWIYLPAYLEQRGFPLNEISLQTHTYATLRPLALVLFVAMVMWIPRLGIGWRVRLWMLWLLVVSSFVIIAPLQLGTFSIWRDWFARLPGLGAVRDPVRIIYLYELAVAIGLGVVMAQARASRRWIAAAALVLIAARWNPETFAFKRDIATFDQWMAAPVEVVPSCRSFFLRRASDAYRYKSPDSWMLYGIDATFIALKTGVPTLNGYSARYPNEWHLFHPYNADYDEEIDRWIARYRLRDVCVFDMDLRTMRPYVPRP